MVERWKTIEGYENYQVSSWGRVKSLARVSPHNNRRLQETITCGVELRGYRRIKLFDRNGKGKIFQIHRLVAHYFLEPIPGCNVVNHLNSDKSDNRVENLEWTTAYGNVHHALNNDRYHTTPIRCLETGQIFKGVRYASRALGIDSGSITKQLNGKLKSIHGLHFKRL